MAQCIQGSLVATGLRLAIVTTRWNHFITDRLVEGALDTIERHGGDPAATVLIKVPGAFEIPLAVSQLAKSGKYDAIIAIGAVIRGSTPHFDYVAGEATKGISQVSVSTGVPIAFGVITADTIEQAIERAGTKMGNKGAEAALVAIEMANLGKVL
ncbi:MAG: 6,7-dimethyl-8-ribityllumazine synthase [Deltaproteobacteria bacterium]|nr:6,7-dimethyl-8-ribityllumazine synthase [Deltaproteobacteria bacterium]